VGTPNLRRLEVRFLAPVRLGDVLELSATVGETAGGLTSITLVASVGGVHVVSAEASVEAP
ncbi:MAG: hypothetical protein JWR01_1758, partial [Subtercola sp.]|nr:hypothetical protein [Subtercola sp.]